MAARGVNIVCKNGKDFNLYTCIYVLCTICIAYVNLALVKPILGRIHLPYTLTSFLSIIIHAVTSIMATKF